MKLIRIVLVLALLTAGGWVLYAYPPESSSFYPRCLLHQTTGWQCPGCGGLRALHQLLHGNIGEAFRLNPLVTVLGPVVAGFVVLRQCLRAAGFMVMNWVIRPLWWWILGGLAVSFGLGRNLAG